MNKKEEKIAEEVIICPICSEYELRVHAPLIQFREDKYRRICSNCNQFLIQHYKDD